MSSSWRGRCTVTGMRYEVRVAGRLSERACCAFGDMTVVPVRPETIIYGEVTDDDRLHRLLALCQDLGLQVLAVREVSSAASTTTTGSPGMSREAGP
jgi:hypothetical protein